MKNKSFFENQDLYMPKGSEFVCEVLKKYDESNLEV
jgi:hypothetical protein